MPRPERSLDPSAGPVERLAADLRDLRRTAGNPAYRELAKRCGLSVTTLSDAAGGRRLPALSTLKAYVRACGGDPAHWEARWRAVSAELARARRGETAAAEPEPYLGLAGFQRMDAGRFFGRERLVEELAGQLKAGGFLAIVGPSGSGKSSLLRAGLLPVLDAGCPADPADRVPGAGPALRGDPALPDYRLFTPGARPMDAWAAFGRPVPLIMVDQFEEIFTLCGEEAERIRFIDAVLDAAAEPGVTVVVAVRADFFGHCARYPRLVAALRDSTALIGPMSEEELGRAVTRPAALAGLSVERALVTKVVTDADGQSGALPMVSHALRETWRHRQGTVLTLLGYEATGGVAGAVAGTAEQVYEKFDDAERIIARQILTRLTALGEGTEDTRRRVERAELDLAGAEAVLDALVTARLLVVGDNTVEIAHEALIRAWPRLRDWLTDDRDALRTHRQLSDAAAVWHALGREHGALYRGARLATVREWADRHDHDGALTGVERAFLDASVAAETAERSAAARRSRQLRILSAGLTILLVVSLGSTAAAVWQWREAAGQRQQALSRQLTLQSQAAAPTDVAAAMRLGLQAYGAAPTVEARGAVLSLASRRTYSGRLPHRGMVKSVAFSPDGASLVAASQDGRITVWDHARRTVRMVLTGHRGAVRSVAYHPGGVLLASGGLDGTVRIWDVGRSAGTMRLRGHAGAVDAVTFSPDGTLLASIGEDHRIRLWRVTDGSVAGELAGHGGKIVDVSFSPDGRRLVSAGDDGSAVVWDLARRSRIHTLRAGPWPVYASVFSPDGRRIATAGENRDVTLWDAATGRQVAVLRGHTASVTALAFTPDGRRLVSAGFDNIASVWDLARGRRLTHLTGHTSALYGVAVSPDGQLIASASRDQSVLLWERARLPLAGHVGEVFGMAVSPDGNTVVSTAGDRTAVLWDRRRRAPGAVLTVRAAAGVFEAAYSPDGRFLATDDDSIVQIWDTGTAARTRRFAGHTSRVNAIAWHPGGTLLASGGLDRTVRVWDAASGAELAVYRHARQLEKVLFSADGRTLISAGRDGTVLLWDVATRSVRTELRTGMPLNDIAVHPDGSLLAAAGPDGSITLWDTARASRVGELTGHAGPVTRLAFSPDGRVLASASQDRSVRLWDVPQRRLWASLAGHSSGVTSVAWSPAGDELFTGGVDHTVIAWTVRPADALARICRELVAQFPDHPARDCTPAPAA